MITSGSPSLKQDYPSFQTKMTTQIHRIHRFEKESISKKKIPEQSTPCLAG